MVDPPDDPPPFDRERHAASPVLRAWQHPDERAPKVAVDDTGELILAAVGEAVTNYLSRLGSTKTPSARHIHALALADEIEIVLGRHYSPTWLAKKILEAWPETTDLLKKPDPRTLWGWLDEREKAPQ